MTSRSVADWVKSEDRLRLLHGEARRLARLQAHLDELLPDGVSGCCSVAALRGGVLAIVTSSPAVATSVSQKAPRIADEIRKREPKVTSIRILVQPDRAHAQLPQPLGKPIPLSPRTRADLVELAGNVSDPRLKAALESLSRR